MSRRQILWSTCRVAVTIVALSFAVPEGRAAETSVLPRFAAIRTGEANLRTGPGVRYPIEWVFVQPHLPVEIIAEYQAWRKVRDPDGTEGWMHQSMLSGRRSILVVGKTQSMRSDPAPDSRVVAQIEPRVIGYLMTCTDTWCRVEIAERKGWLPRAALWGVYPGEAIK